MVVEHCKQNGEDRALGEFWERRFCELAWKVGLSFTPMQIGRELSAQAYLQARNRWRHMTLPDITVWTHPGQHHEIKHKNPTTHGSYGLEAYRFDALMWFAAETHQDVLYTIHNHDLSGGRYAKVNRIEHWFTASVLDLDGKWTFQSRGSSYVNGAERKVDIYYWPTTLWVPLSEYWGILEAA